MMKRYSILLVLFIISGFSFGQQKTSNKVTDSLFIVLSKTKIDTARIIVLNKIAENYRNQNIDQATVYCNQGLKFSRQIKWNDGIALSLGNIGQNNAVIGDIDKADKYFDLAIKYAESELNKCMIYRFKGSVNSAKANYSKAIEYHYKALIIAEKIKDEVQVGKIYYSLGNAYAHMKNRSKAFYYLKKSLATHTKSNLKSMICRSLISIADTYKEDGKNAEALAYNFKALEISKKIDNIDAFAGINLAIAQLYMKAGKLDKAIEYNSIGRKAANEVKFYRYTISSKVNEAEIYLLQFVNDSTNNKKKYLLAKSEILVLDCIESYKKTNDNMNLSNSYKTLSDIYYLQKNYKKEAEAINRYTEIKDSIFSEKSKETVKNLEDQRTIEVKNKEIQINKITLESKEKQKWLYIFGIGFLLIIGGFMFLQSQNRKKTNLKLQILNSELDIANKTKTKFLSILNHDLRSPVYNFIHFMQLRKENPELLDEQTKTEIENKTILSAENLLFSMEDLLLWSKGELENFEPKFNLIAVNDIFNYTKKHFESEQNATISFENIENLTINTDENFLKTIIRNLTGNAIKSLNATSNPAINWKSWKDNNTAYLSITDNGSGANLQQFKALYDENEVIGIKSGLGLHLIRDLAKAINCEIEVISKIEIGTTFVLKLKN